MQSLTRGTAIRRTIHTLIAIPLALAGALTAGSANAQDRCDFITGGGWIFEAPNGGEKITFGVHGGCKNGAFWGHVNAVHHGLEARLKSTRITSYFIDPAPNARGICGEGEVVFGRNAPLLPGETHQVLFRVRLQDNGEPGGLDLFELLVSSPAFVFFVGPRDLGPPGETGGGGNIKLHKEGRSTVPTGAPCIEPPP